MYQHRLNLAQIEMALLQLQRDFPAINAKLQTKRDAMSDLVVENLLAGYALVDRLLEEHVDMMRLGRLSLMLEINHLVLCGSDPAARRLAHRHIEATEQHFYETEGGGIRDVIDWYEYHRSASVWKRAAGFYVRSLSEPQLFLEGNHRSGALVMSYLLAREGRPPFVLTVDNAEAYFRPSTLIRLTRKTALMSLWRIPKLVRNFANYLKNSTDKTFLVQAETTSERGKALQSISHTS